VAGGGVCNGVLSGDAQKKNIGSRTRDPQRSASVAMWVKEDSICSPRITVYVTAWDLLCFSRELAGWLISKKKCNFSKICFSP
jgi:hypothetical protein